MREQDDGCAARAVFQIVFQPFQLFAPKHAEAAFFDIHYVDETDEVNAFLIETVPA